MNDRRAQAVARQTGASPAQSLAAGELYLQLDATGLALCLNQRPSMRLRVDYLTGSQGYRGARMAPRRELIARACGLTGSHQPRIVDATAGLGRDAFVLARLGARVTLIERSPVIAALLEDGLHRARQGGLEEITNRLELICADARFWLADGERHNEGVDVIYLDPMYAGDRRQAAAGKELALLQRLLGPDEAADALLPVAMMAARERVVVKRQRRAPPLADQPPDHSHQGRSTRFDVYLVKKAQPADSAEC